MLELGSFFKVKCPNKKRPSTMLQLGRFLKVNCPNKKILKYNATTW